MLRVVAAICLVAACSNGDTSPSKVVSVRVVPDSVSLAAGDTVRAEAFPVDADTAYLPMAQVSWSTEAASIATVDGDGLITAVATGSTLIDATSDGVVGKVIVVVP